MARTGTERIAEHLCTTGFAGRCPDGACPTIRGAVCRDWAVNDAGELVEKKVAVLSHAQRRALVNRVEPELPVTMQAQLLGISRASLYYQPVPPSSEEVAINHRIDELYTAHPFYGSRKLTALVREEVGAVNRKRVQRYMQAMGLAAIRPQPLTSRRAPDHLIYPYLLRSVTAQTPTHVWGSDITYMRLRHGWL